MILLPAAATVVIGLICIGFIWLALTGGWNLGLDDREDFEHASMTISELIEIKIEGDEDLSSVEKLLDSSGITAIIKKDGSTVFQHGPDKECDHIYLEKAEVPAESFHKKCFQIQEEILYDDSGNLRMYCSFSHRFRSQRLHKKRGVHAV